MSEFRLEPPTSVPPRPPGSERPEASQGSLAAGVGLAWLVMLAGEALMVVASHIGGVLLPPLAIVVWGVVLLNGRKPRTGKGLLLGLLSIVAVALLLMAACFGIVLSSR